MVWLIGLECFIIFKLDFLILELIVFNVVFIFLLFDLGIIFFIEWELL